MVGVGMGRIQRNPVANQFLNDDATSSGHRHGVHPVQKKWVMRDNHLGAAVDRLLHDCEHRIYREQNRRDRVIG